MAFEVTEYELQRVHFTVSSKYDEATSEIEHNPKRQLVVALVRSRCREGGTDLPWR